MRFGAGNLALKPEFVDKNAKFRTMMQYEVIEKKLISLYGGPEKP
jgi:hypothetical protein